MHIQTIKVNQHVFHLWKVAMVFSPLHRLLTEMSMRNMSAINMFVHFDCKRHGIEVMAIPVLFLCDSLPKHKPIDILPTNQTTILWYSCDSYKQITGCT